MNRLILENLERRKELKDNPCDSCDGQGGEGGRVCADCLGQGVLLSRAEYEVILEVAGFDIDDLDGDQILDAEMIQ
jgi:DnaJ-class molecular chaperone